MTRLTYAQIAINWNAWCEYVDPHATMTEGEFDAMTVDRKISLMREAFGPEAEVEAA